MNDSTEAETPVTTWDKHDYLAVSGSSWGRAQSLREAVRLCRDNAYSSNSKVVAYRLSDQTDTVNVEFGIGEVTIYKDAGESKRIGEYGPKVRLSTIPEQHFVL